MPYALYREQPHWVAPLERERRRLLDPRHNPLLQRTEAACFLAHRGGAGQGRIAAVVNPDSPPDERQGYVGFFECTADLATARALFDRAAAWLREAGAVRVLGPVSPDIHHECGLLVDGFDDAPRIGNTYNPAYYEDLFVANGFAPAKDLLSWRFSPSSRAVSGLIGYADGLRRKHHLTVRTADFRRFDAECALVRELYHACWQHNWGFTPLTEKEFGHLARQIRTAAPDGVRIAERDGEAVGFSILLPDLNQALAPARGRLTRYGFPSGAWRIWRAGRSVSRGRLLALGIPESRRTEGVASVLLADALRRSRERAWDEVDVSWVLEDNTAANRSLAAAGAVLHKRHRLYTRCLRHDGACSCSATQLEPSPEESRAAHL
ncbi:GNAT family N-acetyltransferase [Streptomyces sp. URMC 127]|uniref:GNAT family N-acetyltransferase n=1 Tax=Streptomyces sp. URMC 127 TaxID=3423402 RepID=UPI003F1DBEC9